MLFVPSRLTNDYTASAPEMISISSLVIMRLAGAVIFQRQPIDHVAGIAGGVVHRRHLRAVERRTVLEQRLEDLHSDVERQELGSGSRPRRARIRRPRRRAPPRAADVSAEMVAGMICCAVGTWLITERKREKNSVATSNAPSAKRAEHLLGHLLGMLEGELPHAAELDRVDDQRSVIALELVEALLADAEDLHLLAVGEQAIDVLAREPHDGRVEGAAKPALAGADDEEMDLVLAGADHQRRPAVAALERDGEIGEHRLHARRHKVARLRPRSARAAASPRPPSAWPW